MINLNSEIRLTDELERELMQQAIEEQARFQPGRAIRNMFVRLGNEAAKRAAQAKATQKAAGHTA